MVKHTQTIRRLLGDKLSVFDHFVGLALKGLNAFTLLDLPAALRYIMKGSIRLTEILFIMLCFLIL